MRTREKRDLGSFVVDIVGGWRRRKDLGACNVADMVVKEERRKRPWNVSCTGYGFWLKR